jgi:hypothetical protein
MPLTRAPSGVDARSSPIADKSVMARPWTLAPIPLIFLSTASYELMNAVEARLSEGFVLQPA